MAQDHLAQESTILGIDPGTRVTGYGIIALRHPRIIPVDFGAIRPPTTISLPERYLALFNAVEQLLHKYRPNAVAVETQFVYKNVQSAMKLGMARGAVLLCAAKHGVPIFEYAPRKAKLAVAGHGGASKAQIQKRIQLLLQLPILPEPEDAADALALAICHAHTVDFLHHLKVHRVIG